jgi:hypothetical protein
MKTGTVDRLPGLYIPEARIADVYHYIRGRISYVCGLTQIERRSQMHGGVGAHPTTGRTDRPETRGLDFHAGNPDSLGNRSLDAHPCGIASASKSKVIRSRR